MMNSSPGKFELRASAIVKQMLATIVPNAGCDPKRNGFHDPTAEAFLRDPPPSIPSSTWLKSLTVGPQMARP